MALGCLLREKHFLNSAASHLCFTRCFVHFLTVFKIKKLSESDSLNFVLNLEYIKLDLKKISNWVEVFHPRSGLKICWFPVTRTCELLTLKVCVIEDNAR